MIVKKGFFKFNDWADEISKHLRKNKTGVIGHCRIATHGGCKTNNCHPHSLENHGSAFVHNGIISQHAIKSEDSDSVLFGKEILNGLPKNWHDFPAIKRLLESYIGRHNKVIYVFESGHVEILNADAGTIDDGIWYSNGSFRERLTMDWNKWTNDRQICVHCGGELDAGEEFACEELGIQTFLCSLCIDHSMMNDYEQLTLEHALECRDGSSKCNTWEK